MASISCHITPLIISSLRVDTHTHTHTHTHTNTHTQTYTHRIHTHRIDTYAHTHTHTHAHAHTHTHILTIRTGSILRNQVQASYGRRAPGLKIKNLAKFLKFYY